jgi:hypothetical protein
VISLAELEALSAVNPVEAARLAQQIIASEAKDAGLSQYLPHEPTPKQQAFLELPCLEALYGGAAGGGKTDALLHAAMQYAHVPGYAAMLFRRTYTELALPDAIMARSHEWFAGTQAHWSGLDKRWSFPTDATPSTLTFGYLDGPNDHMRYQGMAAQFYGLDELTHYRERQYRYLFSRLRRLQGSDVPLRMRGATNPGGMGHDWCKRRFGIPDTVDFGRIYSNEGRVFVPASLRDNPHLDADAYEAALAELDATQRAQLQSGQWVRDTEGLVYREFGRQCVVQALPELVYGEKWKRILACDFGVVDPTAFVELSFNRYVPEVYITRSEQVAGESPSEAAERATDWAKDCGGYEQIIGDVGGLGKAFQQEWQTRFKLPMTPADKTSKLGFVKLINGDMRLGKIRVLEGPNLDLIECLGALSWSNDHAVEENPDQPNHLTDALLYGWRASRHFAAKEAPTLPAYGSDEWLKKETDAERAKAFLTARKRVDKATRSLTERQLIAKIARM